MTEVRLLNAEEVKKIFIEYGNEFGVPEKKSLEIAELYIGHYNRIWDEIQGKNINETLNVIVKELTRMRVFLEMHEDVMTSLLQRI